MPCQIGIKGMEQHDVFGSHPLACPKPSAQKARERSSMQGTILARGCMAAAAVRGDEREPVRGTEQP